MPTDIDLAAITERVDRLLYEHREGALTCYDHPGTYCCVCGHHQLRNFRGHLADVIIALVAEKDTEIERMRDIKDMVNSDRADLAHRCVRVTDQRDEARAALAAALANPRDEFHTMDELYEYRMLYNALWVNALAERGDVLVCKSWRHSDGEACFGGGWFIVVAELPSGQVSNHYKAEHWDLFQVPAVELPPEYDGHTPEVAAARMRERLRTGQPLFVDTVDSDIAESLRSDAEYVEAHDAIVRRDVEADLAEARAALAAEKTAHQNLRVRTLELADHWDIRGQRSPNDSMADSASRSALRQAAKNVRALLDTDTTTEARS